VKIHKQVLVILLFLFCVRSSYAQVPIPVIVSKVQSKEMADRVEALGTLRANESVTLTATITETVSNIHFQDGQFVESGTLLVELTNREEMALLEEARSRAKEAELQFQRVGPLREGGAAPVALIDERKRDFEIAQAQLRAIESRLEDRLIKAPFSGVLGLRYISVGALVTPDSPIVTIDDVSVLKLDFTVPSRFLSDLHVGLPIIASALALDEREFRGTVASIDSRVDPVTRSIVVRALIPNPEGVLRPGLLMKVDLLRNERLALTIPEEAIIAEGQNKFVFVAIKAEGEVYRIEKRDIVIGAREVGIVEVISGLHESELVVTRGTIQVRPGQVVNITLRED
jgi:membrane fusion protein, multidrug efflux system